MGFFITIEGLEGAGKSTLIDGIASWLKESGMFFCITRDPGGTPLSERIRELLLEHSGESMSILTELLLFFAGRAQNLEQNIQPVLEKGGIVLCDRFTDATYAYQGGGRKVDVRKISVLESLVQGMMRPDLTILLDMDPVVGFKRLNDTVGRTLDRIEQEELDFFNHVREAYLFRAKQYPHQYELVDASLSEEEILEVVISKLKARKIEELVDGI